MDLISIVEHIVVVSSLLHLVLPPYETFDEFPTFKKYYKLVVLIIGNIALNKRQALVGLYKKNGQAAPDPPKG